MKAADVLKKLINSCGFDLRRAHNVPHLTFMGLSERNFRTVLDVGAHDGEFAKYALQRLPQATVYSFEPLPDAFQRLAAWARAGSGGRVVPIGTAVGAVNGTMEIRVHVDHPTSSSFLQTTQELQRMYPFTQAQRSQSVAITTLDTWCSQCRQPLQEPILLKLDVQGFEMEVLRGAGQTLSRVDTCVAEINTASLYESQSAFVDIVNELARFGLEYGGNLSQSHDRAGRVLYVDGVFMRRHSSGTPLR